MPHGEHLNTGVGESRSGGYHSNPYGLHFTAHTDGMRIERAIVDAETASSPTFKLADFTPGSGVGTVHESLTLSLDQGVQEIRLGFEVPNAGQDYLLYRDGSESLMRISDTDWSGQLEYPFMSINGGGDSRDGDTNEYYYYFFDMDVAVPSSGSDNETRYVDIDEYGADPTGSTTSDAALADAINDLTEGDYLVMTNGEYWFDSVNNDIKTPGVTVLGTGSRMRLSGVALNGSDAWLRFISPDFNGSFTSPDATLSNSEVEGNCEIELSTTSGLSEGDSIVISETKYTSPNEATLLWGGKSGREVTPTHAVVQHISGSTVYLDRGLNYDMSSNAGAWFVGRMNNCKFKDIHFTDGDGEQESEVHLQMKFCRDSTIENCTVEEGVGFAYNDYYGYRNVWKDVRWYNPILPTNRASSHWEPLRIVGTTDLTIIRPYLQRCRRGIDLNAGAKVVRAFDPKINSAYLHGACFHSKQDADVYGAYEIYGGHIQCESPPGVDHSKYIMGNGISLSPNQSWVKVIGTNIVGGDACVAAEPGCENTFLQNVRMENAPEYTPQENDLTERFVEDGLKNARFDNCEFVINGEDSVDMLLDFGSNTEDVTVTGSVKGDNPASFPIQISNAENIEFDLNVEQTQNSLMRVTGVDGLHVTGNYDIGRSIVYATPDDGNINNVTVENANHVRNATGSGAVTFGSGSNSYSNTQVLNNYFPNTNIDLAAQAINGVWTRGNVANSITHNSSSTIIEDAANRIL